MSTQHCDGSETATRRSRESLVGAALGFSTERRRDGRLRARVMRKGIPSIPDHTLMRLPLRSCKEMGPTRPRGARPSAGRFAGRAWRLCAGILFISFGVTLSPSTLAREGEAIRRTSRSSADTAESAKPESQAAVLHSSRRERPVLYPRTTTFWSFESGPEYGFVASDKAGDSDVLVTRVGSFETTGGGPILPMALRAPDAPVGPAYVLVQLQPSAFVPDVRRSSLDRIVRSGASIVAYVPNGGYIVKVDPSSYQALRSSPLIRFIVPYHPAFKIAPGFGTAPLPDADEAASTVYSIVVTGFPGVTSSELSASILALGGTVTFAGDDESGPTILAKLSKDQIVPLARIEGVRTIDENLPRRALSEEIAWNVLAGTYTLAARTSLHLAGVTGSGRYLKDVDNSPTSGANPPIAGPEDVDWNGNGILDNAAQIIGITDTGMDVSGGDFSETAFTSGWNGNGGSAGPNVARYGDGLTGRNHRRMAWYKVAAGGFGTGDLASCDPTSSHGQLTASVAAGNASSGPFAPPNGPLSDALDWTGDGTVDDYGDPNTSDTCGPGFCFPSGGVNYRVDGVSPGSRLVFEDLNNVCPEPDAFTSGSFSALLADLRSKGARIGSWSFGAFNGAAGTQYDASAQGIDGFLATDSNRDFMMFLAAGNNGSYTANIYPNGKSRTVVNEGASKNAITVGTNLSGTSAALESRAEFSSIGPAPNGAACSAQTSVRPAPSNCGRIKPDLMAPGEDGGGIGLVEPQVCLSGGSQIGSVQCGGPFNNSGGSSLSAPAAAGAAALIRDYFAQGFYPDGTSSNAGNAADRASRVSGALVKALLVASADDLTGNELNAGYGHRHNPETGYGSIDLRNVLPLATDPQTPSGLLVHDAGCPSGASCPSSLSLPATLGPGGSGTVEFQVIDAHQSLRAALAWIEPVDGGNAGALVDDLDLELRYCGPDKNCATAGGVCAGGPTPGAACTTDTSCAPSQGGVCDMDRVWYGNVFTEDVDDDGTEDQNLDGSAGLTPSGSPGHWRSEGSWSLANRDADADGTDDDGGGSGDVIAARDTRNNVEAVFLSPDPEADGTGSGHDTDAQIRVGTWRLRVAHTATGPDAQKYAVVVTGGVSSRSSIRFDVNPITCNGDVAVLVDETADSPSVDPGCNTSSCPAATIGSRTSIAVTTSNGTGVDLETAPSFSATPGALAFHTARIPVSTAASLNTDDDILVAAQGYRVTATYRDIDCTADGTAGCQSAPAETVIRTSEATYNCTPSVAFFSLAQPGRDAPFLMSGGCDDDRFLDREESFTYTVQFANLEESLDLRNAVVTMRAVVPDNDNTSDPGRLNNAPSPYASVLTPLLHVDEISSGSQQSVSFTLRITGAPAWPSAPAMPPEVEIVVGVSAPDSGLPSPSYAVFRHLLNADNETFLYSTDYPTGATVDRDIDADEKIENPIHDPRNPFPRCPLGEASCVDGLRESIQFNDLTTTAFGGGNPGFNGPWDFDADDERFRSGLYAGSSGNTIEITNWGEDHDYDGSLSGPYICTGAPLQACSCAGNPPQGCEGAGCPAVSGKSDCMHTEDFDGDQDGTLDEGWNLRGGCGFLSHNGTNRGVWHTGQIGPLGASTCSSGSFPADPLSASVACETIDVVPGVSGTRLWTEFLRTPVVQKVHRNPDSRNLTYQVALVDWRWNLNADIQSGSYQAALTWEFDEDTASSFPVDLGDAIVGAEVDGLGPISGFANTSTKPGLPMFVGNDPDDDTTPFGQKKVFGCNASPATPCTCAQGLVTCNDAACAGAGNNCGIVSNGQNGRNRSADRSCMFENLTAAQTNGSSKRIREPLPEDDDCDNDVASLGPDGCPGRCHYDDDGDGVEDNAEEACPCFSPIDSIDDDLDGRRDEGDELQRFYRCKGSGAYCASGSSGFCYGGSNPGAACTAPGGQCTGGGVCDASDCPSGQGPCGRFGNGRPRPYGDDVCGDGSIDEGVSEKWATETALGENGHRIAQSQNWPVTSYRLTPLEDVYNAEAGNSFQGAVGFTVYEGYTGNQTISTYGAAIDDMTLEWSESHPVEQAGPAGCGSATCTGGPRSGSLCFNDDDCGSGFSCSSSQPAGSSCAALSWSQRSLEGGNGTVSLELVDFNAATTQGGFDCTRYGFTSGCGNCVPQSGCNGTCTGSNDCDGDGLAEVEVEVRASGEPSQERFRLEQTAAGSTAYTAPVVFSSSIDAPGDGVVFLQYDGLFTPIVSAVYFDRDAGAGDVNGDGTPDSPPGNGRDGCPGACGVDDDGDAAGPDGRPGAAGVDDDGNGICDIRSSNPGAFCTTMSNCPGGFCLNFDESDELCGRVCTGGTGLCSAGSANAGTVCASPGTTSTCTGGGTCIAANCGQNADCPGGGVCGASPVQRGDDQCSLVDEADERCAIVDGRVAPGIDDNCGCARNPITATLDTAFNVADIVVASYTFVDAAPEGTGDADGFPDDNELISVKLTLRNLSSFDVDDVRVRLTTQDATVQCLNDPEARYGRINALQSASNGADALKFTVANVGRSAVSQILQARFNVTMTGSAILEDGSRIPFEGTAVPQRLIADLDLDSSGGAPPAATTTKTFGFEPSQYPTNAAFNAEWAHTFQSDQPGMHCQYNAPNRLYAAQFPTGCYLAQDTPVGSDDWHLGTAVAGDNRDVGATGTCQGGGTPGSSCTASSDCAGKCAGGKVPGQSCLSNGGCRGACSLNGAILCNNNTECSSQAAGLCNNPAPGTCTGPAPGTCVGLGSQCLHLGAHVSSQVGNTITHTPNNIMTAQYRPTLQIGLGRTGIDDHPEMRLWQQVSLHDNRSIENLPPISAIDAAVVQVLVDRNGDGTPEVGSPIDPAKDGYWEKIHPYYGVPTQRRFPTTQCQFDPIDDGSTESDLDERSPLVAATSGYTFAPKAVGPSSTCYPEFVWACAGDTQDPPYDPQLGQVEARAECFPEVDSSGNPIVRQGPGPGRWVEARFDLSRYSGRKIWFRFLYVGGINFVSQIACAGAFPCDYAGGNRDDGWFVDEIKISGTNATPFNLVADADPPPASSCPAANCSTITAHFSGSTYVTRTNGVDDDGDGTIDESGEGKFTSVTSDAPLRPIDLDAQDSANPTVSDCIDGVLQYRYWVDTNADGTAQPSEILRDFSDDPKATASSACEETIRLSVRCSAPAPNNCTTVEATLAVQVGGRAGGVDDLVFGADKNHIEWGALNQTSLYDVATKQGIPGSTVSAASWLGAAGYFDTFSCRGNGVACNAGVSGRCTYGTASDGAPAVGTLDLWLVRQNMGSWQEVGATGLTGPVVTRDTRMVDDGTPVCP